MTPHAPLRSLPLALALWAATATAAAPPEGRWVGTFSMMGRNQLAFARFGGTAEQPTLQMEVLGQGPLSARTLAQDGAQLRAEFPMGPAAVTFQGALEAGGWRGHVEGGPERTPFHFAPVQELAPAVAASARGLYRAGADHFFTLESARDGLPALAFHDFRTGAMRVLFADGPDRLFGGTGLLTPLPKAYRFQLRTSARGAVTGVTVTTPEGVLEARKVPVREQPVTFRNGAVTLSGTLLLPPGRGPFPAVVLTQTSSRATRDAYRESAAFFVSQGLAALVYDKRGTGASTGDLARVTFPDLAADAVAAVHALQARKDIRRAQVGAWGASQGGWVVLLAAAQSQDVAFVIPTSGPTTTPAEQELYRIEHMMRAEGAPEADVQKALAYQARYFEFLRTNRGRDGLADTWQEVKGEAWARSVYPLSPESYWEPTDRDFFFYDPLPALAQVRCPVLAVYGGQDVFLPVDKSIRLLKEHLGRAGQAELTVLFYPEGDHGLGETGPGGPADFARLQRTVPALYPDVARWLAQRTAAGARAGR